MLHARHCCRHALNSPWPKRHECALPRAVSSGSGPTESTSGASVSTSDVARDDSSSPSTSRPTPTPGTVSVPVIGVSGAYMTSTSLSSLDGDFLERELVGRYELSTKQVRGRACMLLVTAVPL